MWWNLFSMIYSLVSSLLITIFGYLLPALCSAKAVVSSSNDDIQEWLTYWIVFIFLNLFEILFNSILYPLKFSNEIKILIICYLTLPYTQGAYRIFHAIILPYFLHYEDEIDQNITNITNNIFLYGMKVGQRILWNIIIGNDTSAFLGPVHSTVQNFLGVDILRNSIKFAPFNIPNTITEINIPSKTSSQVNLLLSSLKNSKLILDLAISETTETITPSMTYHTCHCRLLGKFYLELVFSDHKFVMNEKQIATRNQIMNQLTHSKSHTHSSTYILSILDIHSIQTIECDDDESDENEGKLTPKMGSDHVTSVGITFLPKDMMMEHQLHLKISPCSELFPDITSPSAIKESLVNLSNCFQILSSRSRGLVWKKINLLLLKISKILDYSVLFEAFLLWKNSFIKSTDN